MARVFISYSDKDSDIAGQVEQGLIGAGISVWRDKRNLYAGQHWPKALGEAIAAQDFFLLTWSKNAEASRFVELE